MMPGCLSQSPGAGRGRWGPGTQLRWPPYSAGHHRASLLPCLLSFLDTLASGRGQRVYQARGAGHPVMAALFAASWTSPGVPRTLMPPVLLFKAHLSFQAHFKCHHLQEALLDTQGPLLSSLEPAVCSSPKAL